jgi:hypothetical protein
MGSGAAAGTLVAGTLADGEWVPFETPALAREPTCVVVEGATTFFPRTTGLTET